MEPNLNVTSVEQIEFLHQLGYGSFGLTHVAKVIGYNELQLSVKEVDPTYVNEVAGGISCMELIMQEIGALQGLKHPNLLRPLDMFFGNGKLYITHEYCPGGSMLQMIEEATEPIPEFKIKHWFGQLTNAVSFLHEKQLLHCGIKPENIMLTSLNQAILKLMDSGTTRMLFLK